MLFSFLFLTYRPSNAFICHPENLSASHNHQTEQRVVLSTSSDGHLLVEQLRPWAQNEALQAVCIGVNLFWIDGNPSAVTGTQWVFSPLSLLNSATRSWQRHWTGFEFFPTFHRKRTMRSGGFGLGGGGWKSDRLCPVLWLTVSIPQLCGRKHQRPFNPDPLSHSSSLTDSTFFFWSEPLWICSHTRC